MKQRSKSEWRKLNKAIYEAYVDKMEWFENSRPQCNENWDVIDSEYSLGDHEWVNEFCELNVMPTESGRRYFPNHHIEGVLTVNMLLEEVEAAKNSK